MGVGVFPPFSSLFFVVRRLGFGQVAGCWVGLLAGLLQKMGDSPAWTVWHLLQRKHIRSAPTIRGLVAPYRAILRYYRCDTPYRAMLFKGGGKHSPKWCDTPLLILSFRQAHLCDTPFCNVSRDDCAIPHKRKQARKSFAILSLQASRDMKSIAAGPLRSGGQKVPQGPKSRKFQSNLNQKNPRAHKNKIGTPPPPQTPPPPNCGILWKWVFLQKERIFPGVHKIGAAISGPRIADTNFTDTRIFLTESNCKVILFCFSSLVTFLFSFALGSTPRVAFSLLFV